jgi:aminodeoxyfutalosine deaminase
MLAWLGASIHWKPHPRGIAAWASRMSPETPKSATVPQGMRHPGSVPCRAGAPPSAVAILRHEALLVTHAIVAGRRHGMQRKQVPTLDSFISALPKAELHLHLEGTIMPGTWLRIIRRHEPNTRVTEAELRERMRFRDLPGFFDAWMSLIVSLREPEDFRIAAVECGLELGRRNVRYTELHSSIAGAHIAGRANADEVIPAIAEGLNEARAKGGPEWRLIVDIIRDLAAEGLAGTGLGIALRNRRHGVVAVGLGGSEDLYPADTAREVFKTALEEGLHTTAHAGEGAGPESIRAALDIGAQRIGHATHAPEDSALVDRLDAEHIPLEMCPSSNVCTGAVPSLAEHPIAGFLRRGMAVILNTDDPAFFGANINEEYVRVATQFELTPTEVLRLARNAFECAFLPDAEKAVLLEAFDAEIGAIC